MAKPLGLADILDPPKKVRVSYDKTTGQFRDKGKAVPQSDLDLAIAGEALRLKTELRIKAVALTQGRITFEQWQESTAKGLKDSHIRMAVIASGGKANTVANSYLIAGRNLKSEYENLRGFAQDIKEGNLSKAQIVARAQLYSNSIYRTYYETYHFQKVEREGFTLTKRDLDPFAKHCPDCPGHATGGKFRPADQVTPKGVDCACRGNCRCRLTYKVPTDKKSLTNRVLRIS
jgi:hypothetical protein